MSRSWIRGSYGLSFVVRIRFKASPQGGFLTQVWYLLFNSRVSVMSSTGFVTLSSPPKSAVSWVITVMSRRARQYCSVYTQRRPRSNNCNLSRHVKMWWRCQ